LAAAGRARLGEDRAALAAWLEPRKRQLEELLRGLEEGSPAQETVAKEVVYLREHQSRMDYRRAQRRKEPLGSGAVEATCVQYQCPSKRTGQFWSLAGNEALLCLDSF
jgi:hypothetical protein